MNREIPYSYYFPSEVLKARIIFPTSWFHQQMPVQIYHRFSSVIRKFLGFCLYSKVIIRQKNILKFKAPNEAL